MNHFSTLHVCCKKGGIQSVCIDGQDITPAVKTFYTRSSEHLGRTIAVLEIDPDEMTIDAQADVSKMYTRVEIKKEGMFSRLSRALRAACQELR